MKQTDTNEEKHTETFTVPYFLIFFTAETSQWEAFVCKILQYGINLIIPTLKSTLEHFSELCLKRKKNGKNGLMKSCLILFTYNLNATELSIWKYQEFKSIFPTY